MFKSAILLTLICLSLIFNSQAQIPKNNINFEILGTGFIGSLNYERVFIQKDAYHIAASLGLGASIADEPSTLPFTFTFNKGMEKNFLQLGLGYTGILDSDYREHFFHGVVGYKRIGSRGFSFNIRLTPIYFIDKQMRSDFTVMPWGGMSFGYSF